jgi:hypothetical protein
MPPYKLETLAEDQAVVLTILSEFNSREHLVGLTEDLKQHLDANPAGLYIVAEIVDRQTSFDDLIYATNEGARGAGKVVVNHPNLKGILLATSHKMWHLAARGLRSDAFGNVPIQVFEKRDEVLTQLRKQRG